MIYLMRLAQQALALSVNALRRPQLFYWGLLHYVGYLCLKLTILHLKETNKGNDMIALLILFTTIMVYLVYKDETQ